MRAGLVVKLEDYATPAARLHMARREADPLNTDWHTVEALGDCRAFLREGPPEEYGSPDEHISGARRWPHASFVKRLRRLGRKLMPLQERLAQEHGAQEGMIDTSTIAALCPMNSLRSSASHEHGHLRRDLGAIVAWPCWPLCGRSAIPKWPSTDPPRRLGLPTETARRGQRRPEIPD